MVAEGQQPVGPLDLLEAGVRLDAQDLVVGGHGQ
jgi:hypothetical protein